MIGKERSKLPFLTKITSVVSKVPLLSIHDEFILNSDGSITVGFFLNLQSMEGLEESFIYNEISLLANTLQGLPITTQNIYVQIVFFNSLGVYDIYDRRMSHPNINQNLMYKYSCENDFNLFFKNSYERECLLLLTVFLPELKLKDIVTLKNNISIRNNVIQSAVNHIKNLTDVIGFKIKQLSGLEIYKYSRRVGCLDDGSFIDIQEVLYPIRRGLFKSDLKEIDTGDIFYMQTADKFFAVLVLSVLPSIPTYISNILYHIDFPFIYTCNIMLTPQDIISKYLSKQRWLANMFKHGIGEASAINQAKVKAIDNLFKDITTSIEKWHLCKIFMSFIISDDTLNGLKNRISRFRTICSTYGKGIVFFTEWLRKTDAFVASIPGCAINSYDTEITTMPIAARQVPLRGEFKGSYDEYPISVFQNRYNGLVVFTPFSDKQSRWSAIIIGPSGQGKSFLINRIIFDLQIMNPFMQIIDMATEPSYEMITTLLGGNYYPVSLDEKFRVNVFDLAVGISKPIGMKLNYLMSVLLRMQTGGDIKKTNGAIKSLNNRAIQILYDIYMKDEPKRLGSVHVPDHLLEFVLKDSPKKKFDFWLEYRDYYIQKYLEEPDDKIWLRKAEVCQNIATPTLEDFVRILYHPSVSISEYDKQVAQKINREMDMYVIGGMSIMFNGITLLDLNTDSDIYTFFLGRLTDPNIISVLLICYRDFFMRRAVFLTGETASVMEKLPEKLYNIRRKKKLVLYDEFHNIKRDPFILEMIDREMRQSRTFGVGVYLSTQELSDVLREETALVSSCSNKIFLRTYSKEEPTMRHIEEIAKHMGFTLAEVEMLKSLEFKKGEYADAMILQQDIGRGIIRYRPNSFIKWVSTTDVNERSLRDTIINTILNKDEQAQQGNIMARQQITAKVINLLSVLLPEPNKIYEIDEVNKVIKQIEKEMLIEQKQRR